jgi:hypothetical protein
MAPSRLPLFFGIFRLFSTTFEKRNMDASFYEGEKPRDRLPRTLTILAQVELSRSGYKSENFVSGAGLHLPHDVLDVDLYGVFGDEFPFRNFLVRQTLADEAHDLRLSFGKMEFPSRLLDVYFTAVDNLFDQRQNVGLRSPGPCAEGERADGERFAVSSRQYRITQATRLIGVTAPLTAEMEDIGKGGGAFDFSGVEQGMDFHRLPVAE